MKGLEFTDQGVKVGEREFKLLPAVTREVLHKYGSESRQAGEAYAITLSAIDSMNNALGDYENLIDRIRKTLRARDLAWAELDRLSGIFSEFYEPRGIKDLFPDSESFTDLVRGTILTFSSKRA